MKTANSRAGISQLADAIDERIHKAIYEVFGDVIFATQHAQLLCKNHKESRIIALREHKEIHKKTIQDCLIQCREYLGRL
jgi:hypothetical protein